MVGNEYRTALQAQNARYEDATGLPIGDVKAQEYRDYFGIGDCAGERVETRVTPKAWLVDNKREANPGITPEQAFLLSGKDLAVLAAGGDYAAECEIVRRAVKREAKREGKRAA